MYGILNYPILPPQGALYPQLSIAHPCFSAAVFEGSQNLKLPLPMICLTALSSIAAVLQNLIDIEMPSGNTLPVSLNAMITVPSGGGKNRAINLFKKPIEEFEKRQMRAVEDEIMDYRARLELWCIRRKDILRKNKKYLDDETLMSLLSEHDETKPKMPASFRIIFEDSTPEALLASLGSGAKSAWLVTSEGGIVLSQHSMKNIPALNQLWSGDRVTVDRKTSDSFVLDDVRISVLVMSQPGVFDEFIGKYGALARDCGFFARCLVLAIPQNAIGQFEDDQVIQCLGLEHLHRKLVQFLNMSASGVDRSKVRFSPEARRRWVAIQNAVVQEVRMGGRFDDCPDLAARTPENIARVSALLHFFEGGSGDISVETLEFACHLCFWHVDQFLLLFSERPSGEKEAKILYDWFLKRYRANGQVAYPKNYVRQMCPNSLRTSGKFAIALEVLCTRGYVVIQMCSKRTLGIVFYPGGYGYVPN